jgi:hypothetical protein
VAIEGEDTEAQFVLTGPDALEADLELRLETLRESWDPTKTRQNVDDAEWITDLAQYLAHLVDLRAARVEKWLNSNTQRFQAWNASIDELRITFDSSVADLRASIQLCKTQCAICKLFCVRSRLHKGSHDCLTNHECIHDCTFCQRDFFTAKPCGQM